MNAGAGLRVGGLHVYPVKSCRGIALDEWPVGRMGLRYDRQWAFVDERGMFLAQRESRRLGVPVVTMCRIATRLTSDQLILTAPDMPALTLPLAGVAGDERRVQVWESVTSGVDQGEEAAAWGTEYLSRERPGQYRLVRMADDARRPAKRGDGELAYADAYSFLVVAEASLADLNRRLAAPLPMNRFRPNLVIAGGGAHVEDGLDRFRIGDVTFTGTTLCVRCPITTTDQQTGERGQEPLKTLATYRKQADGVVFGRNFNHAGTGSLRLGQALEP